MYTFVGWVALLIWSAVALILLQLTRIPTFEILGMAFSISFLVNLIRLFFTKKLYKLTLPTWPIMTIGVLGILGNETFFITALKYAPSAQVTLIYYLWPIFTLGFLSFLPQENFSKSYFFASILALMGFFILVKTEHNTWNFNYYFYGYLFAFLSAFVWSMYMLKARYIKNVSSEIVTVFCGVSAFVALCIHCLIEPTVPLTLKEGIFILLMGCTSEGLAYFLWDKGIKKGNYRFLCLLSYFNPLMAVGLLSIFGYSQFTFTLFIATLFVSLASISISKYLIRS